MHTICSPPSLPVSRRSRTAASGAGRCLARNGAPPADRPGLARQHRDGVGDSGRLAPPEPAGMAGQQLPAKRTRQVLGAVAWRDAWLWAGSVPGARQRCSSPADTSWTCRSGKSGCRCPRACWRHRCAICPPGQSGVSPSRRGLNSLSRMVMIRLSTRPFSWAAPGSRNVGSTRWCPHIFAKRGLIRRSLPMRTRSTAVDMLS